ncbi:MAG: hypothetical protein KatS3mg114_0174 [Planctomycetaceae bacterium]|nr:MAG: hypothetical protein KatS3mg114_0174 [Planctomycetaceae bacterium]
MLDGRMRLQSMFQPLLQFRSAWDRVRFAPMLPSPTLELQFHQCRRPSHLLMPRLADVAKVGDLPQAELRHRIADG